MFNLEDQILGLANLYASNYVEWAFFSNCMDDGLPKSQLLLCGDFNMVES